MLQTENEIADSDAVSATLIGAALKATLPATFMMDVAVENGTERRSYRFFVELKNLDQVTADIASVFGADGQSLVDFLDD